MYKQFYRDSIKIIPASFRFTKKLNVKVTNYEGCVY